MLTIVLFHSILQVSFSAHIKKDFCGNTVYVYIVQYLIVLCLVESPFRRIFQQQITDLTLVYNNNSNILLMNKNAKYVFEYTLKIFENLKHLSVIGLTPIFSTRYVSLAACLSSNLYKLCLNVNCFEDCFALLDGRFKHLTMLSVNINDTEHYSSVVNNIVSLYIIRFIFSSENISSYVIVFFRMIFPI